MNINKKMSRRDALIPNDINARRKWHEPLSQKERDQQPILRKSKKVKR